MLLCVWCYVLCCCVVLLLCADHIKYDWLVFVKKQGIVDHYTLNSTRNSADDQIQLNTHSNTTYKHRSNISKHTTQAHTKHTQPHQKQRNRISTKAHKPTEGYQKKANTTRPDGNKETKRIRNDCQDNNMRGREDREQGITCSIRRHTVEQAGAER